MEGILNAFSASALMGGFLLITCALFYMTLSAFVSSIIYPESKSILSALSSYDAGEGRRSGAIRILNVGITLMVSGAVVSTVFLALDRSGGYSVYGGFMAHTGETIDVVREYFIRVLDLPV